MVLSGSRGRVGLPVLLEGASAGSFGRRACCCVMGRVGRAVRRLDGVGNVVVVSMVVLFVLAGFAVPAVCSLWAML